MLHDAQGVSSLQEVHTLRFDLSHSVTVAIYNVVGSSPAWSSSFGFTDAVFEIEDRHSRWHSFFEKTISRDARPHLTLAIN